jgi:hypothetical protein
MSEFLISGVAILRGLGLSLDVMTIRRAAGNNDPTLSADWEGAGEEQGLKSGITFAGLLVGIGNFIFQDFFRFARPP